MANDGRLPDLYLTARVWENVLVDNPGVTALILFGVMLIVLMTVRPQGLLGTATRGDRLMVEPGEATSRCSSSRTCRCRSAA